MSDLEETLAFQLTTAGISYEREYQFDPKRKWRVDFRILGTMLLVEINGGTWMQKSGHNTGTGIQRDYEKSNAAQLLGFTYLQYTKKEIDNLIALDTVRRLVGGIQRDEYSCNGGVHSGETFRDGTVAE